MDCEGHCVERGAVHVNGMTVHDACVTSGMKASGFGQFPYVIPSNSIS